MRAADVFCGSGHKGLIVPAQSLKGLCNVNQQCASRIVHWGHISTKYISTQIDAERKTILKNGRFLA